MLTLMKELSTELEKTVAVITGTHIWYSDVLIGLNSKSVKEQSNSKPVSELKFDYDTVCYYIIFLNISYDMTYH